MKKCIYFGPAEDFWYPYRFKEFMDNLENTEALVENNFTPMANALDLPLLYYSHEHNVLLKYERDRTFEPEFIPRSIVLKAKIYLFGGDKRDIEDLEWLIKEWAKKYKGIDNMSKK